MTVEKISSSQPVTVTPIVEKQAEIEKNVQTSSGNTKDVVTALSVLAALGAAWVAIYKHKNAKKAIEEAEKAAKKKVEEAEEKAKKAAEDAGKKVKEAVDKVKQEYEKDLKKTGDTNTETSVKKTKRGKYNSTDSQELSLGGKKGNAKPAVEDLEEVYEHLSEYIGRRQNGIIVIPESTKLARFVEKTTKSVKDKFNNLKTKLKNRQKSAEPKVLEEEITETKRFEKLSNVLGKTKDFFSEKWESFGTTLYKLTHRKNKNPNKELIDKIKKQLSGKPDYKKLADALVNEPHTQVEHDALQALYNTLAIEEPKTSEIFKGIKFPDIAKISEENLLAEYKALENIVKKLPVENPATQRYLKIQGELLNHRGYKIQENGEIKKIIAEDKNKPFNEKSVKQISNKELLIEYYILKRRISNLPVESPLSQRYLEIQGELVNHRGYRLKSDGRLKKIKVRHSLKDRIKKFFS